jgi:hypothetical protein
MRDARSESIHVRFGQVSWSAFQIHDRNDAYDVGAQRIEDGVRKTRNQTSAHGTENRATRLWLFNYRRAATLDLGDERHA